jgi:murein DD-endopeptidase MepM/ murein hydrolase activator NlpD
MLGKVRLFLVTAAIGLTACTMMHPPAYRLPHEEALVAGKKIAVKEGENLYTIAQTHKVKLSELIYVNKIKPPYRVKRGDYIALPARAGARSYDVPAAQEELMSTSPQDRVTSMPLEPLQAEPQPPQNKPRSLLAQKPAEKPIKREEKAALPPPPPGVLAFGWPVRGTIISAYGPKGKGRDNDGINIAAPKGAPVKAAEYGTIVYADNKMKGFGNLVLIRHREGWVTAYAHLDRVVVSRDDVVKKGSVIGTVGTTGGVASPQLHFEARRDGKPVDPELVVR